MTEEESKDKSMYPVFEIPSREMLFLVGCHLTFTVIFAVIGVWNLLQQPLLPMPNIPMWFAWLFNIFYIIAYSLVMGFLVAFILVTIKRLIPIAMEKE